MHNYIAVKDASINSKGTLQDAFGMSSPWLQLLDCLCQWVWTHPPRWQPKSPMQFGSLPGMGRCVQVRGAVEPSPGGDARVSGRGGLGWGVGWEGDWGGGEGREGEGVPREQTTALHGGELRWRDTINLEDACACACVCVLRRQARNSKNVFVLVSLSYLLSWKSKQFKDT